MKQKVFCIGMFKTGTTTMGKALQILGYETLHGPWWPQDIMLKDSWFENPREWDKYDEVLKSQAEQYEAFQDYPWMYCFEKCDHWFPNSKFILTARDPDKVAASDIKMWNSKKIWKRNKIPRKKIPSKDEFINRYNRHYESVIRYFEGKNNLLIVNISEGAGWSEICKFLDVPIPDTAFPHENKETYRYKVLLKDMLKILGFR